MPNVGELVFNTAWLIKELILVPFTSIVLEDELIVLLVRVAVVAIPSNVSLIELGSVRVMLDVGTGASIVIVLVLSSTIWLKLEHH